MSTVAKAPVPRSVACTSSPYREYVWTMRTESHVVAAPGEQYCAPAPRRVELTPFAVKSTTVAVEVMPVAVEVTPAAVEVTPAAPTEMQD